MTDLVAVRLLHAPNRLRLFALFVPAPLARGLQLFLHMTLADTASCAPALVLDLPLCLTRLP